MIESSIAADRASQDELEDELENIINWWQFLILLILFLLLFVLMV